MQELIYYMLNNKEVISIVINSHLYFPIESYRILSREIAYFYEKYGYINMADFSTYLSDNLELKKVFNEIIALDLNSNVLSDIILDYVKVIKDYNVSLEIKRLENLVMKS
jgi:hypothetical protein